MASIEGQKKANSKAAAFAVRFMAFTGLRKGDTKALRWRDIKETANPFGKSRTPAHRRMYAGDIKVIRGPGTILIPASEGDRLQSLAAVAERSTRQRSTHRKTSAR